jgi:hypothetical protein
MESPRRLFVHPRSLRATYLDEMRRFLADTESRLGSLGISYLRARTCDGVADALRRLLAR